MLPDINNKEVSIMTEMITEKVQKIIDKLRPNLQADGGDIEFLGIDKGVVKVKLKGACAGCPMSMMTIKWGVENTLKKEVPEVVRVDAIQ
jgi:Fe-S cluster biogenesis protein NfuA